MFLPIRTVHTLSHGDLLAVLASVAKQNTWSIELFPIAVSPIASDVSAYTSPKDACQAQNDIFFICLKINTSQNRQSLIPLKKEKNRYQNLPFVRIEILAVFRWFFLPYLFPINKFGN